jgi:hypothetical protein
MWLLTLIVAVAEPFDGKPVVPNDKLMLVDVRGDEEAHYLCAALTRRRLGLRCEAFFVETQIATRTSLNTSAFPVLTGKIPCTFG